MEAAGLCHNRGIIANIKTNTQNEPLRGLRASLVDSDQRIRFAAAVSLSRLGDDEGIQELIRLSYDKENGRARGEVVRQMGQTGRSRFVPQLIRLAWTESNDLVKREILRSLDELVPPQKRPKGLLEAKDFDAKIDKWVDWSKNQTSMGNRDV